MPETWLFKDISSRVRAFGLTLNELNIQVNQQQKHVSFSWLKAVSKVCFLTTDLFLLAGTGFSLSGSPCWQSVPWQRGRTRKAPCCGTVLPYTPSLASYTHSMSLPSPWRPHWLKELTSDPDRCSAPTLSPTARMLMGSNIHLSICRKRKYI